MFLRTQEASDLVGLRGVGLSGGGIFYPTMQPPDSWALPNYTRRGMSLEEARELIEREVAARPALASPEPSPAGAGEASATTDGEDNDGGGISPWLVGGIALVVGAVGGGAVMFGVRRR